jgi:hypothetical protein
MKRNAEKGSNQARKVPNCISGLTWSPQLPPQFGCGEWGVAVLLFTSGLHLPPILHVLLDLRTEGRRPPPLTPISKVGMGTEELGRSSVKHPDSEPLLRDL